MIGIFQGKKTEYNKLILKALVFGPKTVTQLAEHIYLSQCVRKPSKINLNEVRKKRAIISRRGSRLEELKNKNYIFQEGNLYELTMKGKAVALTLVDSVYDIMPHIIEEHRKNIPEALRLVEANPFLKTLLTQETLREILHIVSTPEFYQRVKDITNRLITIGVNIDNMTDLEFQNILASELFSSLIRERSLKGTRFNKLKDVLLDDLKRYEKQLKSHENPMFQFMKKMGSHEKREG